jgi:hypothetical protein
MVTGNGHVDLTDPVTGAVGTGYFTLEASKSSATAVPNGSVTFYYPGGNIVSTTLTGLTFAGTSATIDGLCAVGSSCTTFRTVLQDNGVNNDLFQAIRDALGAAQGGAVRSGNVKMYEYD